MSYAAELDGNNIVLRVIVGTAAEATALLGGTWADVGAGLDAGIGYLLYDGTFYAPWVGTTNAMDVYGLGAWRYHPVSRLVFENITPDNAFEPGVSGWRNRTGEWPQWFQPAGAHDAYRLNNKVSDAGRRWTSTNDANVWPPGTPGVWTDEGPL